MKIRSTIAILTLAASAAATTSYAQTATVQAASAAPAPAPAQAPAPTRVLVIPFAALNVPDTQQYLAKAPVETIVADLGRGGPSAGVTPILFHGQVIVEDNATAARLAREANAAFAIRGS